MLYINVSYWIYKVELYISLPCIFSGLFFSSFRSSLLSSKVHFQL